MTFSDSFIGTESAPDAIMAAKAAYDKDPSPGKIATFIGQITDPETGRAYTPSPVREALIRVVQGDSTYLASGGEREYLQSYAKHFLFGPELWEEHQATTVALQSHGGTGALHLAKALMKKSSTAEKPALLYDPGWPNHEKIFKDFSVRSYTHEDPATHLYNHEGFMRELRSLPSGSSVLPQVAGYNGDGIERRPEQWEEIADVVQERQHMLVFDAAYNGLAEGWDPDVFVLRLCMRRKLELVVCASQSKNAGLYGYRTGAFYVANVRPDAVAGMQGFLANDVIRSEYSNPCKIGAAALAEVYRCDEMRERYRNEVDAVRTGLITGNRNELVDGLGEKFSYLHDRRGIFLSVGGMTDEQQRALLEQGVHGLKNGRICVASLHPQDARKTGEIYGKVLGQ